MPLDKELISFKKIFNKPHTSNKKTLLQNEDLFTFFQSESKFVFNENLPTTPPSSFFDNDGIVERIRLDLEYIEGTSTTVGRHAFRAKLPSDYETNSTNPKSGSGVWTNSTFLSDTDGEIQIVDESLGGDNYIPTLRDGSLNEIPILDERDWILYSFNGIIYQETPPVVGVSSENPVHIDCWIFIGDSVKDAIADLQSGGSNLDWQNSVIDKDLSSPPGSPIVGDRYIVGPSASGLWSSHDDEIAEWNGMSWQFTIPNEGFASWVEDEDLVYYFDGLSWDVDNIIDLIIIEWKNSVLSIGDTTPPGSPNSGDRYIIGSGATGAWTGQDNNITEWNGSSWKFVNSEEGFAAWVDDIDTVYHFDGSSWLSTAQTLDASEIFYDNSSSGLSSTNIQDAIDEVLSTTDKDFSVSFDFNDAPSLTLKTLSSGDLIRRVIVDVESQFTAGFTMTLGFPADQDEIISASEVNLRKVGLYKFEVFRLSTTSETLTLYFQNSASTGNGIIYIEE